MPTSRKLPPHSFKLLKFFSALVSFLILSKVAGPIYGPIVLFLFLAVSISPLMPSKYVLQRVAVTAILIIGLSPIYLIFRGMVTKSPLGNWDLQIYSASFFSIIFLVSFMFKGAKFLDSYKQKLENKSYLVAGFSGLFSFLVAEVILTYKSVGHAVAWVASGDSKNHFVNGIDLIRYGFLDPASFLTQPVSSPTYLSLNLSQGKINFESISENLSIQMQIYAHVWIVLIGLVGLVFAATLEITWSYLQNTGKKLPMYLIVFSSLVSTLSVIIGPTLYDGFFTAILGISSVGILISWFLEIHQEINFSLGQIVTGVILLAISLMSWMFVIPFTLAIFIFGARINLGKIYRSKILLDIIILSALILGASMIHFSEIGQSFIFKAKSALTAFGTVSASDPNLYFALLLGLISFGIVLKKSNKELSEPILLIAMLSILALAGFKNFSNLNFFDWNYYLIKYQWIILASLVGLLVSIFLIKFNEGIDDLRLSRYPSILFAAMFIFFASEAMVPSNNVWLKIWQGWENPRSLTINAVLEQEIDRQNPTMFFHYGYAGDAMLANFWLTAFSEPVEPLKGWNYTIDTSGDVQQICDVNAYYPTVTIVTSDTALESLISETCPIEEFNLILKPSVF
jgi:hypothetical protein